MGHPEPENTLEEAGARAGTAAGSRTAGSCPSHLQCGCLRATVGWIILHTCPHWVVYWARGWGWGVVESFQPGMVMSKSCSQESTLAGMLPKVAGVCPCLCLHCGLDSFLRGLTLTRTLSREATLRLWTPLAGSKPGSRSVLSLMADRKAPAALWKCSQGVREFSERGVDLEGLLSVWCPPCPKQGQIL